MTTNVTFEKITPDQLNPGAIVPQALDNQWAPTKILNYLTKRQKSLISWKGRERAVLSEWRRSLVYAPQVVVNRAALINNSVIVSDYSGENKKYFRELLSRRVIVDCLITEEAPDERPDFDINDEKWMRWLDVIRDSNTNVSCVRLDWGEQKDDFINISSIFHQYIQTLNLQDRTNHLINAFKIPSKNQAKFREKLVEVAQYAFNIGSEGKHVVRNNLYKIFVCIENTPIDEGHYDKKKAFSTELKEIFDLRYIVNLPDALGRYAFTPKNSPDRTLLGDLSQTNIQNILKEKKILDFIDSLKRLQFATLNDALYIKGLDILSLADVIEMRSTDEWEEYITSLNALLSNPMQFEDKVDDVSITFTRLNKKISDLKVKKLSNSAGEIVTRWQPRMMILLSIGSVAFELFNDPSNPSRILVKELSGPISVGLAPLAVNLKIMAEEKVDLGISINFMRSRVNQGKEVCNEIRGVLKSDPRFKFLDNYLPIKSKDADQSRNEGDYNDIV